MACASAEAWFNFWPKNVGNSIFGKKVRWKFQQTKEVVGAHKSYSSATILSRRWKLNCPNPFWALLMWLRSQPGCGEVNIVNTNNCIFLHFLQCISRAILVQTKCKTADCSGVLCPLSNALFLNLYSLVSSMYSLHKSWMLMHRRELIAVSSMYAACTSGLSVRPSLWSAC